MWINNENKYTKQIFRDLLRVLIDETLFFFFLDLRLKFLG